MGKSSGTTQKNVVKKPRLYSSDIDAVVSTGGAVVGADYTRETAQVCMIKSTEVINFLPEAAGVLEVGLELVIIAPDSKRLDILGKGRKLAEYKGENAHLIRTCMAKGYKYKGKVLTVLGETVGECMVMGYGRV